MGVVFVFLELTIFRLSEFISVEPREFFLLHFFSDFVLLGTKNMMVNFLLSVSKPIWAKPFLLYNLYSKVVEDYRYYFILRSSKSTIRHFFVKMYAGGAIRTLEPLQEQILSLSPLTRLGYPCII